MKTLVLILAGSALANVGLLAVLATRPSSTRPAASAAAAGADATAPAGAGSAAAATRPTAATPARSLAEIWENPTREDLPGLVAQLRAAGYPADVVHQLVSRLVQRLFADRERAIRGQAEPRPYWQGTTGIVRSMAPLTDEQRAALRSLQAERNALVKELLGTGMMAADSIQAAYLSRSLGPFSAEKLEQTQEIRRDYQDLRQSLTDATGGGLVRLPEDEAKLKLLAQEEEADLRAVLTPDEYFEYQLRTSSTVSMLRFTLAALEPTEAEFRAIARAVLERGEVDTNNSSQSMAQIMAVSEQLATQGMLSADRLADLKIVTDPSNLMISRVLARYNLPIQAASEVSSIQRDIMQRAGQARAAATGNPAQTATALADLNREASARLQTVLGDRALAAYRENGGQWLQTLQTPVRTSTARPATP